MLKTEALREAKASLRGLRRSEALTLIAELSGGVERGKGAKARSLTSLPPRYPQAVTTTGRTPPRTTGLRSC